MKNKKFYLMFLFMVGYLFCFSFVFGNPDYPENLEFDDSNIENLEIPSEKLEELGIDAEELENMIIETFGENLQKMGCSMVKEYSNQIIGQEIPKQVPYKNEILNFYISNQSFGNVQIVDGTIVSFECEMDENPTYDIFIKDYSVFLSFSSGFNIDSLIQEIENKNIEVYGKKLGKKIKWFFSKIALKWFF